MYALIHRYDNGVPPEKTSNYYLLPVGNYALFFPLWSLSAFIIITVLLAICVLIIVWKRRVEINRSQLPTVPAIKLFFIALLIQACVWLSESLVGLIKGVCYPSFAHPEGFFILGFFAALIGIALSLKLTSRLNLSHDPYRWFLRTAIFLVVYIFLLSLINVNLALYPALALFFIALAMLVHKPWFKLLLWILSPHFMFRLIFSEGFLFLSRSNTLHFTHNIGISFILHTFYILFFALWSFPFLLGFAAVYFDSNVDLFWLKRWRTLIGSIIIITAFLLCVIILSLLPSYSDEWRSDIIIDQSVDLHTGKGRVVLKSSEYLKDLNVHFAGKDTTISTWDREILLKEFAYNRTPWIQMKRTVTTSTDSSTTFDLLVELHFKYRPIDFILSYSAGKNSITDMIRTVHNRNDQS